MAERGPRSFPHSRYDPVAAIFDLDGTLTDNMPWHARAFEVFMRRHGLPPLTMELRRRLDGKRNDEIMPVLFGRDLTADEQRDLAHEKETLYRETAAGQLEPMPGLLALLDALEAREIPVAVATSGPRENVSYSLREIGLADRITVIVRGDEVPHGKPAPDIYLRAAELLGVDPARCLGFEDAPVGVEAIVRAGMRCVALTTSFDAAVFSQAAVPPHVIYRDFDGYLAAEGAWLRALAGTAPLTSSARRASEKTLD